MLLLRIEQEAEIIIAGCAATCESEVGVALALKVIAAVDASCDSTSCPANAPISRAACEEIRAMPCKAPLAACVIPPAASV